MLIHEVGVSVLRFHWFCLFDSLTSQWLSLFYLFLLFFIQYSLPTTSARRVFFFYFCCIFGKWNSSHSLTREKEDNNFQKRWMDSNNLWEIYGDFPHKYPTSTNKARFCSRLIFDRRCCSNKRLSMNALGGCKQPSGLQTKPHYHKELILSSVSFVRLVFLSPWLSAHWCVAFVLRYKVQLSIKHRVVFLKL